MLTIGDMESLRVRGLLTTQFWTECASRDHATTHTPKRWSARRQQRHLSEARALEVPVANIRMAPED
jgi:hypothetical protein